MNKKILSSSEYILDTSREYSIYVCTSRAIPNITDGLKASQRKMLWVMRNQNEKIKTISLAGKSIQEGIYLAGDQSASDAISHMAAPYCNNVTLLEGVGTFGSRISPRAWGAPRYTYVKKSKSTEKLIYPDLDIIPLKENYDGSTKEPETFLPLIPLVLLNGISGIAVGWSTEILPRSLNDIIDASLAAIDNGKIKKLVPKYDFLSIKTKSIEKNVWEFQGRIKIVDSSTVKITELPPSLDVEKFRDRLNKMEEEDLINDYTDNSTNIIDIDIKLKRANLATMNEESLLDFFKLKEKSTERIVVINWDGNTIKWYENAERVVEEFVVWRLGWYTIRYNKLLNDTSYELKWWLGVQKCFNDGLPDRIRTKKNKADLESDVCKITKQIGLDDKQIDKILNLPSYKWAQDFYQEVKSRIKELENDIKNYKSTLRDKNKIKEIYKKELIELKNINN